MPCLQDESLQNLRATWLIGPHGRCTCALLCAADLHKLSDDAADEQTAAQLPNGRYSADAVLLCAGHPTQSADGKEARTKQKPAAKELAHKSSSSNSAPRSASSIAPALFGSHVSHLVEVSGNDRKLFDGDESGFVSQSIPHSIGAAPASQQSPRDANVPNHTSAVLPLQVCVSALSHICCSHLQISVLPFCTLCLVRPVKSCAHS